MYSRPPVPSNVKRQLRQESGFGCCKCGRPIIEYHHIVPFTQEDPHFRPEDMMCLCPYCHHEATVNAMTIGEQRLLKKFPKNIVAGKAEGLLKINQKSLVLEIGNILFITDNEIISIDNEPIIQIKQNDEGRIDLTIKLYDSKNILLLHIEDNEWISGDFFPWDIEAGFQWITIRERKGRISLNLDARKFPISILGTLYYNGEEINITKDGILFKNTSSFVSSLCFVGSSIMVDSVKRKVKINVHPVYKAQYFISNDLFHEKIVEGLDAFKKMKNDYLIQNKI